MKNLPIHGDDRVSRNVPFWREKTRPPLRVFRSEDGQALVELALVLPILLLILLGIVDFGRAINYWNDENHLANIAARYAAVGSPPTWSNFPASGSCVAPSDLVSLIHYEACIDSPELSSGGSGSGVQSPGVSVCVTVPATNLPGDPITVKITANYKWLPFLGSKFGSATSTTLSGSATMRLEASAQSWVTSAPVCT